ncbi:hypothetical protein Egran_02861 [Elaphomyces granulatus]|uniref:Zn(2)-C6 fungal-type domain-containing protein n=1 Tax=Elaphomyces granulatus TaxID=519963 RepID=A0A232LYY0_9EURO|nr:hypothetical protein Egran_02861 [Elaphomyces granulatus]
METIRIPPPSAILDPTPRNNRTAKPVSIEQEPPPESAQPASTRPKQSKSRNGCITCKAKRLKCDETKPTCQQCRKRNVPCGGYKKDFKWRPFEEATFTSKSASKPKRATSPSSPSVDLMSPLTVAHSRSAERVGNRSDLASNNEFVTHGLPLNDAAISTLSVQRRPFANAGLDGQTSPSQRRSFVLGEQLGVSEDLDSEIAFEFQSPSTLRLTGESALSSPLRDEDKIEEVIRQSGPTVQWSSQRYNANHSTLVTHPAAALHLREPSFAPSSEEMLILRFNKQTCGILSIKDGSFENPWRTSIWPLAKQSPALWHAVFAMAAFHSSKENPTLRLAGVDHMRKSISCMVQGMEQMRTDAALATTLSLAFAESWDRHTSTGIEHLNGAKALIRQALGAKRDVTVEDRSRLRFLYNTWVYMDVIARLTSLDEGNNIHIDPSLFMTPHDAVHEVDPLMGCASTLFPLIGKAASLIQRVRKSESNSIALISEAIEVQTLIKQWEPPEIFDPPEDPTSDIQHSLQTADAYRWATLLYLHQAFPEIPSEPATELARNALVSLATVPISSRTTIIHIYPLLAASCEADKQEDRNWVIARWAAMQARLKIGNIDRCVDVVRQVWQRRDFFAGNLFTNGSMGNMGRGSAYGGPKNIEFEKTVRGRLHWISVMKEWNWEGSAPLFLLASFFFLDNHDNDDNDNDNDINYGNDGGDFLVLIPPLEMPDPYVSGSRLAPEQVSRPNY